MLRILVIDSDQEIASALANAMKMHRYLVEVCPANQSHVQSMPVQAGDFNYVILNLSRDRREDWELLDHLCRRFAGKARSPWIIAYSLTYRGAERRGDAEQKGARFIYED